MTPEICLVLTMMIVCATGVYLQRTHYDFLKSQWDNHDAGKLSLELEARIKEFDEYKKRIDALTLRSGLKL